MTEICTPLIASANGPHDVTPREVTFTEGPLAGKTERVSRAHEIAGHDAIASFHGEGYYRLPDPAAPTIQHVVWEPHPDARFSWVREV